MGQTPPGSLGLPYLGEAMKYLGDPFEFQASRTKQHGNVWKTRLMGDKVVFFVGPKAFSFFMNPENFTRQNGSPKFLQEILHPDAVPFLDGDRHKTRKRLLLTAFRDDALESYLPGTFRIFARFVKRWMTAGEVAIATDLGQASFDIADMLFAGADPDASNQEGARDFTAMLKGTFSPPVNMPFTAYGKAIKARDRLRTYIAEAVATRDGKGSALGVLKAARGPNGEQLTSTELEIELLHFYFAAQGGVLAALAWLFVVMGQHPELFAKLRAEADAVLGDEYPTLSQVRKLATARAVVRETLRVYPFVPNTFVGIAKKDLEYEGFTIPAGWKGMGSIWSTHQDGATFADPTAFQSDRLADSALAALPDSAYVPQGGGPADGHRCAGEALTQAVLPAFVGWFTRHYDLAWPEQDASPGGGGLGRLPKSNIRVLITPRAK